MGSKYIEQENPIRDILIDVLTKGGDIAGKKIKEDLHEVGTQIIQQYLENPNDIVHLDFDIKKSGIYNKVIGNNIITALWLSGILPRDPLMVLRKNICNVDDGQYKYDEKTKSLTFKLNKK